MKETLIRIWENLVGRTSGPLHLRLMLQPTVAVILAIRAGIRDSRLERPPYFWNVLINLDGRNDLLRNGWKDVGKLFIMACVVDVIYQLIVESWVYPVETLIVALVLAIIPYVLLRGLTGRLARRWLRRANQPGSDAEESR